MLHLASRAEVEFQVEGCTEFYCHGLKLESDDEEIFFTSTTLDPGWVTVYARVRASTTLKANLEHGDSAH